MTSKIISDAIDIGNTGKSQSEMASFPLESFTAHTRRKSGVFYILGELTKWKQQQDEEQLEGKRSALVDVEMGFRPKKKKSSMDEMNAQAEMHQLSQEHTGLPLRACRKDGVVALCLDSCQPTSMHKPEPLCVDSHSLADLLVCLVEKEATFRMHGVAVLQVCSHNQ